MTLGLRLFGEARAFRLLPDEFEFRLQAGIGFFAQPCRLQLQGPCRFSLGSGACFACGLLPKSIGMLLPVRDGRLFRLLTCALELRLETLLGLEAHAGHFFLECPRG